MIENEITDIKTLLVELNNKIERSIKEKNELASTNSLMINSAPWYNNIGIQCNTEVDNTFYKGSVAIARGIKKPSSIVSGVIENLNLEEKGKFLTELKPILKKYLKDEQLWEDFNLAFAEKIQLR